MGNVWQKSYIDVHEATQSGHIDEVRRWVDDGKPVDARDNTQKTPLHHAAQWGQEEALDFLIECGADVNAADFIEDTPLHLACYFGHANCARILIMVGADVCAKDCYGNAPSQIFDDHVTEPVLDEIRFLVREVIKGPCPPQEPEHEMSGSALPCNQEISGGGLLHGSISSTPVSRCPPSARRKDSYLSLQGGANSESESEYVVSAEGAVAAGAAAEKMGSPSPPIKEELNASIAAAVAELDEVKRSGPSHIGRPLTLGAAQEEKGDRPRIHTGERSSVDFSVQQRPHEAGQEGAHASTVRGGITREANAAAGAREAGPDPPGSSTARGKGMSEPEGLAPRLKLSLPWDDEGGPGLARTRGSGGESEKSPVTAGDNEGGTSARTIGAGGSAAAGLTYPGPRPLSAPLMRPSIGSSNLNATSPVLSGKTFEGTSVGRDRGSGGNKTLGRTAGASLAGRLMSYATRPGGTFDVFAAARDGQVSVLKQALAEGEEVDVLDEAGLTPLMWAARAGRLSTAKYLVSQGASLERRDDATGFSPLHFAAYYCRSSVVRVLVLGGADTKATDNRGKAPGACFQTLSYLSYEAFHHRRLIRRFLTGDLKDGMVEKGKTMFPMNSPLEAYDEEHRPQCVPIGSRDNITAHSDQSSVEQGYNGTNRGSGSTASRRRSRSRPPPYPGKSQRRASADIARKAYATMHTMHSRIVDDSSTKENSMSEVAGRGSGGGGGVRYYLRRGSMQQVAAKTRKSLAGTTTGGSGRNSDNGNDSNDDRPRSVTDQRWTHSSSRPASSRGGAEGGVSFYLRRSSLQGLHLIENFLSGGAKVGEPDATAGAAGREGASSAYDGRPGDDMGENGDNQAAGMARDMAIAVARFEAAATAAAATPAAAADTTTVNRVASGGSGDCASSLEEQNVLDSVEAGRGSHNISGRGDELARRDRGEQGERRPSGNRRPSRDSPRGDCSPTFDGADVESGTRTMPPPRAVSCYPGLEQDGAHPKRSQERRPRGSAASTSRENVETEVLASDDASGDASLRAQQHGGRDNSSSAAGRLTASTLATVAAGLPLGDPANGGKATAAAQLDTLNVGDGKQAVTEGSGGTTPGFAPPRAAAGGELGIGSIASAVEAGGKPTSRPETSGSVAAAAVGAPRGAGASGISSTERENQLEEGSAAAEERHQAPGPSDLVEDATVPEDDKPYILPQQQPSGPVIPSTTSLNAETSRGEGAAAEATTPLDGSSDIDLQGRKPVDALSVGSLPSSIGEGKEDGGMGSGTEAGPILSGEESTTKRHSGKEGKSSGRNKHKHEHKHKHKHKRSHRHRDKSSDEGGSKSRPRRSSRDHGLLGSTSAPTVTALAPLKRIPPPSSSSAHRAIPQGDGPVGGAALGGDDGGGGGGGGG